MVEASNDLDSIRGDRRTPRGRRRVFAGDSEGAWIDTAVAGAFEPLKGQIEQSARFPRPTSPAPLGPAWLVSFAPGGRRARRNGVGPARCALARYLERSRCGSWHVVASVTCGGSVVAMTETVIQGPPVDPVDQFRTVPMPSWQVEGEYGDIIYEVGEGIARITINRPERRNAFRPQTLFELADAFERARDNTTVGVIVLTGAGPDAFCSGGDQKIRGEDGYIGDDDVARQGIGRLNVLDLQVQIRRLPKPVIASIAGYAIGGGHILHLVCDLSIAADNARFGQTGPKVGSFDGGYGSSLLARSIGLKRAKEVWFLCRQYDAATALEWGLVNTVVPLADLEAETVAWCRQILTLSPIALRMLKAGFNAADDGLAGVQQLAGDATMLFYMSEEGQEGRNAFVEHRAPDFSKFPKRP